MLSIYVQCLMEANQEPGKTSSSNPDSSLKNLGSLVFRAFSMPEQKACASVRGPGDACFLMQGPRVYAEKRLYSLLPCGKVNDL